ncbi:MAG: hypothetical protein ABSG12_12570 [Steroidobacteraceae bacterium]
MWRSKFASGGTILLISALLGTLAGCGHPSSSSASKVAAAHTQSAVPSTPDDVDMVAAVSSSGNGKPISMKFRVTARPLMGESVPVNLAITVDANSDVDRIEITLKPGDGLQLKSDPIVEIREPPKASPQIIEVDVQPTRAGLLTLEAIATVDSATSSLTRTYSIPLIAIDPNHLPAQ